MFIIYLLQLIIDARAMMLKIIFGITVFISIPVCNGLPKKPKLFNIPITVMIRGTKKQNNRSNLQITNILNFNIVSLINN
jgi:hypothetical protein